MLSKWPKMGKKKMIANFIFKNVPNPNSDIDAPTVSCVEVCRTLSKLMGHLFFFRSVLCSSETLIVVWAVEAEDKSRRLLSVTKGC